MFNSRSIQQTRLKSILTRGVFVCVFILSTVAHAQLSPPSARCISVETDGTVTLSWVTNSDTGNVFGGYFIYGSPTASGPFSVYDSVKTYGINSIHISGVNANNFTFWFYIKTREGCCSVFSVPSDTLRTIRMITTPLSNEQVRLNWNRIHIPSLVSSGTDFRIEKELSSGIFTPFRTTPDTFSADTNYFCSRFINFRAVLTDASGCESKSSLDGELFRDTRGPVVTAIDTVSIDPVSGNLNISWLPDSSADTQGYVIYLFNGVSYDSIGSTLGLNSLAFTYAATLSGLGSETFSVAAFDSCRNLSPPSLIHKSIFLSVSTIKCDATANLTWTPYVNMKSALNSYQIWYRIDGGPWTMDGTVAPSLLSYSMILTSAGSTYDFLVKALSNDGRSATSNMTTIIADIFVPPAFLYIRSASVRGGAVDVLCHTDVLADTREYKLLRSESGSGPFNEVNAVPFSGTSDFTITDLYAGADEAQKFYKLIAEDSCGNQFISENIASTIYLQAAGGNDFTSSLSWTPYGGWPGPVGYYNIARVSSGIITTTIAGSVSGDSLEFTEDVSNLNLPDDNYCYAILAQEALVNSYGFADSAWSNIACSPQEPAIFIPNAFTPGGNNPLFYPLVRFDDSSQPFVMQVFNRWGQVVFESEDKDSGWDGTFSGTNAPAGLYAFNISFKALNGKQVNKTGTVTLIR